MNKNKNHGNRFKRRKVVVVVVLQMEVAVSFEPKTMSMAEWGWFPREPKRNWGTEEAQTHLNRTLLAIAL